MTVKGAPVSIMKTILRDLVHFLFWINIKWFVCLIYIYYVVIIILISTTVHIGVDMSDALASLYRIIQITKINKKGQGHISHNMNLHI